MVENGESPAEFDPIRLARELLRTTRSGSLATLDAEGHPFASLVTVATDIDGSPLLLLSRLAAHTTNLDRDPRASLLLARTGKGDPLAHPRLTLIGRVGPVDEKRVRRRFLRRHPKAELYADFPDFGFRRLAVERVHLNGGFARAASLVAHDLLLNIEDAASLMDAEEELVALLNGERADMVSALAGVLPTRLAGERAATWLVTGIDPEGIDLLAGERTTRITFSERVDDPGAFHRMLA